jgi:ABC-type nitrate/sulfonate/bicarbonate transport system substrate-binding protein
MMKRNVCCLLCVLMLFCAGQSVAEQLEPVTLQLNWFPTVQFAGILVAKERGWYEEVGIDLTIQSYDWDLSPIDEVTSGRAQIGIAEGDDLIKARVKGAPVKAISVQYQKSPFCLISKKDANIDTPKQLAGKKIGIADPASELMVRLMLATEELQYEDITPVEYKWDLQFLIDDTADVIVGFMNDEPLTLQEKGHDVQVMPGFKYGYDFYSGAYFVTETVLQEQPELLRRFLDATFRGWRETFKNPEAAATVVVNTYFPDGTVTQQTGSLKVFQRLMTLGIGEDLIGYMKEQDWAAGIDVLYDFQHIDKKVPATDLFTLQFLK